MIDHLCIVVSNFAKSKAFYQKALEPLGYKILDQFEKTVGFGKEDKADFWISEETDTIPTPLHFAFGGENRDIVKA
ncbi:MAG TPA: VOC family protein, partial [Bdellovibrionota bacterium]|nr:VOC family protein [Bdellovibrionota bacterium]